MSEDKKDWQISYIVDNLIAPEFPIVSDDILIRRGESEHQAYVFFKFTEEERGNVGFPKKETLEELLFVYALETLRYSSIAYWRTFLITPILDKTPFGRRLITRIPVDMNISEEQFRALYQGLELATDERKKVGKILSDKKRKYIRNALEYFYKSLGEDEINKRLIDLIISLESLFSPGIEIRYRVSIRMATLLGCIGKDKKRVFDLVYSFYNKRNRIVHGDTGIDINWEEFYEFESYLQDCCRIYLYLNMARKDVLTMLDESLILESSKGELVKKILSAYEQWKASKFNEFNLPMPRQIKAQFSMVARETLP